MLEFLELNRITGGKVASGKKISQLHELAYALNNQPELQKDLLGLMDNPEMVKMLSDPNKMSALVDLFNSMDPALVSQLPAHFEEMRLYGII